MPRNPGLTANQRQLRQHAVTSEIRRQKSRGPVPAGWQRWAKTIGEAMVHWRKMLARELRGAMGYEYGQRLDYHFGSAHGRAQAYCPFLPPSLRGNFKLRISTVIDTSGSISSQELARCLSEVGRVLLCFRVPVTLIPCNAVAYESVKVVHKGELARLALRGDGGTNMIVGIEAALKARQAPFVVLVLTDGYTPWPQQRYGVPVIFGILKWLRTTDPPMPPMLPWRREDVMVVCPQ